MSRLDPLDTEEESASTSLRQQYQELGDHFLIGRVRHIGERMQSLRHTGKGKEAFATMIVERPPAEWISGEQHAAARAVPERERVISYQVL